MALVIDDDPDLVELVERRTRDGNLQRVRHLGSFR
ncbi:hypothetical protein P5673_005295 [Acropora cervicornis]|uniref:Uncharacterized protein n=1 Tax=Acropora cervicornis TaxID=6130 RepID=A0AAD9R066_ACRCE|nr:hypothetical protein P5673_005295 [Acropora cervicornis]